MEARGVVESYNTIIKVSELVTTVVSTFAETVNFSC